jgi:outer membrane protein TolC
MSGLKLLVAGIAFLAAQPAAHATKYTLTEIVERVSRDFPAVAAAREGVAAAQAQLRAARLAWLPAGDATLFLSGSPNVKCLNKPYDPTDVDNAKGSNTPDPNQAVREANCMRTNVVSLNNSAAGSSLVDIAPIHGLVLRLDVTLNQPIYSFGRIEAGIAAGKASVENATAALQREQAEAVLLANRAYFGVKAARAALGTLNGGR